MNNDERRVEKITDKGEAAENLLCEKANYISANTDKSSAGLSKGDCFYNNTFIEFPIEVKTNTWNQTRPHKYIPVVGFLDETKEWVVVPPDVVVEWASGRKGQHCKNPFECIGFAKPRHTDKWEPYFVKQGESLEQKIVDAYWQGEENSEVKDFCAYMSKEIEDAVDSYKQKYKKAMEKQ